MSTPIIPLNISANRQIAELRVLWNDQHVSVYPFGLLRAACPCAACRGGHENMRAEPDPLVFEKQVPDSPETRIRRVETVGSYGITIEWEDGHYYGIYNWHYLRALCPCPIDRGQKQ